MDQYKDIIHKAILLAEEIAKKTGNIWDDQAASIAHAVFDRWFGIVHGVKCGKVMAPARYTLTVEEVAAMPDWLQKILQAIAAILPLFV